MRYTRQDYLDYMTFGPFDRPWLVELFGPLIGLEAEWRAQGATEDELSLVAFDFDHVDRIDCGGHTGMRGGLEPVVIRDDEDMLVQRDRLGRTMQLVKSSGTLPLPIDFPVKTMDDWLRLKPMFAFDEARIDWDQVAKAEAAQAQGALVTASIEGAFDRARELMGEEIACCAYYDQPELMHDLLDTLRDTAMRVFERVTEKLTIDQLSVHEDLAGRSGPLAGPTQVREFFMPYYRPVWDLLHSRGTRLFSMDTDGNIDAIVEPLLNCGLTCIYPMEPAAGMDIVAVRKTYGQRLAVKGGIDKFALMHGRDAIRRELEYKMQPLMRQGGAIFGLDHRIPNGTPLEAYRYYVDTAREILGLPPRNGTSQGWARMAF